MKQKKLFNCFICFVMLWIFLAAANAEEAGSSLDTTDVIEIIFYEDFEGGIPPGWSISNGLWEICLRSAPDPDLGNFYVGTICDGNYPNNTNSRLISPSIDLTEVAGDEEIHLVFWQTFSYYPYGSTFQDWGQVQVSTYDEGTVWSDWQDVGNRIQDSSPVWSLKSVDLTDYAGQQVRIAFYHTADIHGGTTSSGWFVDDVEIISKAPELTWDFECGWDDWYADRGLWQVGTPTYGPSTCYSGTQCVGTNLSGNYPDHTDSKLISPTIRLPEFNECETISLDFRHWFSDTTSSTRQSHGMPSSPPRGGFSSETASPRTVPSSFLRARLASRSSGT